MPPNKTIKTIDLLIAQIQEDFANKPTNDMKIMVELLEKYKRLYDDWV